MILSRYELWPMKIQFRCKLVLVMILFIGVNYDL